MSSHFYSCPHDTPDDPMGCLGACDLDGPRDQLCIHCLTKLVQEERPANWSPRVKKVKEDKKDG